MSYEEENDHIFDPKCSISRIADEGGLRVDWKSVNSGRAFQALLLTPNNDVEATIHVPNVSLSGASADTSQCLNSAKKAVQNYQTRTASGPVVK